MGFLSGIFGGSSEWDGAKYVEAVCEKKLWHKYFIDMDEMRRHGLAIALEDDFLNTAPRAEQSPKTIVGELVFLFEACLRQSDEEGLRAISKAINHLLSNHQSKLYPSSEMRFMSIGYRRYL